MGSIRVRPETGQLFMDFRYAEERRREQTLLADTPENRKRLEKALAKIEAQIAAGTFDYAARFSKGKQASPPGVTGLVASTASAPSAGSVPDTPMFSAFAQQWLAEHQIEWRRSHIKVLRSTLDGHLIPFVGAKPAAGISKADILGFRSKLAALPGRGAKQGLSHKRINGIIAPLRKILSEAADSHGFISPTLSLRPLRVRKTDVEPFTLDEVERLLGVVRADCRDYFTMRFFSGMRTGECHGLKWKHVDFENKLILVRETFVLGEDEYTKTGQLAARHPYDADRL
jgi:integrase